MSVSEINHGRESMKLNSINNDMSLLYRHSQWLILSVILVLLTTGSGNVLASSAEEIDREADAALLRLYEQTPVAKKLADKAEAILVFPSIVKAGLVIGGQFGEGVLRKDGKSIGYYKSGGISYGLQAGAQSFGYTLFLMTPDSVEYLKESAGWEIGVGPSVVLVDEGIAESLTTTTAKDDIYAFIFGQKGLMAGLGLQGTKITKIEPDK
jgi:lipid-binding SYLF domain-containing protein